MSRTLWITLALLCITAACSGRSLQSLVPSASSAAQHRVANAHGHGRGRLPQFCNGVTTPPPPAAGENQSIYITDNSGLNGAGVVLYAEVQASPNVEWLTPQGTKRQNREVTADVTIQRQQDRPVLGPRVSHRANRMDFIHKHGLGRHAELSA